MRTLGEVQKLKRKVVHARCHIAQAVRKIVVRDGGGNGGEQPKRGGEKRFGDTGTNGAQAGAASIAECEKGVDDAPHRTKQTDERCDGSGGGQPVEVGLQFVELFADFSDPTASK